ncbi:hypothetical protein [Rhizobium sp. MHM7A]|uniref:hypothetical protein n=1 Tax=Rhizobium sp. MHM7A TaxID=2583233 RepID=UPI0011062E7C|nr:hypothetical protein [Rhizobium sp. MHM7A]TLX16703.1 hypothetical protein FFR93_05000 [Rhizobium sp. MHM7A]
MAPEHNDDLPQHDHRTYSIGHEMELNRGVDLEDLKKLSNALEAASELDASRPLAHFDKRFSAAELVTTKTNLRLIISHEPVQVMAKLSLFTRFKNAIYGGLRLNNMGLTVTAYSCLREAQEVFDLLRLVNVDANLGKAVISGGTMTAAEILNRLVPFENDAPEYAKRRQRIHALCAPMGPEVPPIHFEMDGDQATMDIGGRRIEDAQKEFIEVGSE